MERKANEIEALFNLSHSKFAEVVIRQSGEGTNAVRTWIQKQLLGQVSPLIGFQRCLTAIEKFNQALLAVYQPSRNAARCRLVSETYLPIFHEALSWISPEYLRERVQVELLSPLQTDFLLTEKIDLNHAKEFLTDLLCQFKKAGITKQLIRKNQTSDGVKIVSTIAAQSLEQQVLEAMDKLRSSILEELPETAGVYRFIETMLLERLRRARVYQIPGLFINPEKPQGQQGEVRNIRVTILEPLSDDKQKIVYEFEIAEGEKGQKLRQSVEMARSAAINTIKEFIPDVPDYIVRIEIEGKLEEIYEGDSLGLAVALAIFAAATNQQVGIETVGDLAVTGAITSDNGAIGPVAGIVEKAEAALQAGMSHLLLPEDNMAQATNITDITTHPVSNLKGIITSGLLFDPWYGYLNALIASYGQIELTQETWQAIFDGNHKRLVAFRRFYADKATEAEGIVRRFAFLRLNESDLFVRRDLPVPILLDIADFHHDSRFLDVATATINNLCEGANIPAPESSVIERDFLDGRAVFVKVGLDDYEPESLPFFLAGGGMADVRLMYQKNKRIFVCQQSAWERRKGQVGDVSSFSVVHLHEKRSTFLDKYIAAFTDEGDGKAIQFLLGLKQMQLSPRDFFYGKENQNPLYLQLSVQEIDPSGNRIGETRLLSDIIKAEKERRILLFGDGGAGKTTLLLKTFFDCIDEKGELFAEEIVPVLANFGELEEATKEGLETLIGQTVEAERQMKISQELRDTTNLLLMFDGLNEIEKTLRREGRKLAQCIRTYVSSLGDENWIVIATRSHEVTGEGSGVAHHIIQDSSFKSFEILPVDIQAARNYLEQAVQKIADKLWDSLGGRQAGILQSPMLIYLLSTLSVESLAEERLTKSLIYKQSLDEWIQRQWGKTFQRFEPIEYRRAPRELLKSLAYSLVEEHSNVLTKQQAIEILDNIKKARPDWWPARLLKVDGKEIEELTGSEIVLVELIGGGLLKPIGVDRVKFLHDSIGHFLAGEALCDKKAEITLPQLLDQKVGDRREYQKWRESLCFFVGLLETEELDDVIRWCSEYRKGTQGIDFLADCLLETERFDLMEKCACDSSEVIRTTAVRYIYHLWNREHARGLKIDDFPIIDNIAQKIRARGLLKSRDTVKAALESCISLSALILTKYFDEGQIVEYFHQLWRSTFERLLLLSPAGAGFRAQIRTRLHRFVLNQLGIRLAKKFLKSSDGKLNDETFDQFFNMSDAQREQFIKILPYLDSKDKDLNEVADEIFALAQVDNVLLWMTAFTPVYIKGIWDFDQALPFIKRLFSEGNIISKYCALRSLCNIARYQSPLDERVKPLFLTYVKEYWRETKGKVHLGGKREKIDNLVWAGFYFQSEPGRIKLWDELLTVPGISEDVEILRNGVEEVGNVGLRGFVPPALMTLESAFNIPEVHDILIATLAKLRNYSRSEVEYFLAENGAGGQELLEEVLSVPTVDSVGDLLNNTMESFIQWILLSPSDNAAYMKQWLRKLLEQGAQCKKMNAGLKLVVNKLLDLAANPVRFVQ